MKRLVIAVVVIVIASAGVAFYTGAFSGDPQAQAAGQGGDAGGQGRGGGRRSGGAGARGGGSGGGFSGQGGARAPMTVEVGQVTRASIGEQITVVGNLIADATVSVAPRAAGRLEEISVKLGDRVNRNQRIAKIEDYELIEQVKQAEAAQAVASATIRQRDADLKLAETNAERSRSLFQRQILPKQTVDDNEARLQAAVAQLDLARAQEIQSKARLDELRITLSNTVITSPVTGFVAKRAVDPGAFVSQNVPIVDVVDITRVRLVANIVEKDLKELQTGNPTEAQVDAFPGESFKGRIARVSPVLDPTTRTAPIEIEILNANYRLRPGMYARVGISTGAKKNALVVPSNAVVDLGGRRGVFIPQNDIAIFRIVQLGLEQPTLVEVLGGLNENEQVITTGASALRDGDRIVIPGQTDGGGRRGRTGGETAASQGVQGEGRRNGGAAAASQGLREGRRSGGAGAGRGAPSP